MNNRLRRLTRDLVFGAIAAMLFCDVVMAVASGTQAPARPQPDMDIWSHLRFKTAWVYFGAVDVTGYRDILNQQPTMVRENVPNSYRYMIPPIGSVVRVVTPIRLMILNYATRGERDRLIPPIRRPTTLERDWVGIIPIAQRLKIVAYRREKPDENGLQSVFARVVPAPDPEPTVPDQ